MRRRAEKFPELKHAIPLPLLPGLAILHPLWSFPASLALFLSSPPRAFPLLLQELVSHLPFLPAPAVQSPVPLSLVAVLFPVPLNRASLCLSFLQACPSEAFPPRAR